MRAYLPVTRHQTPLFKVRTIRILIAVAIGVFALPALAQAASMSDADLAKAGPSASASASASAGGAGAADPVPPHRDIRFRESHSPGPTTTVGTGLDLLVELTVDHSIVLQITPYASGYTSSDSFRGTFHPGRAGFNLLKWDGNAASGKPLPAGQYHVKVRLEGFKNRKSYWIETGRIMTVAPTDDEQAFKTFAAQKGEREKLVVSGIHEPPLLPPYSPSEPSASGDREAKGASADTDRASAPAAAAASRSLLRASHTVHLRDDKLIKTIVGVGHDFPVEVSKDVDSIELRITGNDDAAIANFGPHPAGVNVLTWSGNGLRGSALPPGEYQVSVYAEGKKPGYAGYRGPIARCVDAAILKIEPVSDEQTRQAFRAQQSERRAKLVASA